MNYLLLAVLFALMPIASPAFAAPIMGTLDGCVMVNDPRLAGALWSAAGTFQAVAFDDRSPGCEPTIATQINNAFLFDEDRIADTLAARLNLSNLPTCGRRQYDLHFYLADGVLDPFGLKSLVIDTGILCESETGSGVTSQSGAIVGNTGVAPETVPQTHFTVSPSDYPRATALPGLQPTTSLPVLFAPPLESLPTYSPTEIAPSSATPSTSAPLLVTAPFETALFETPPYDTAPAPTSVPSAVPQPSTLAMLAVGALALARRSALQAHTA